MKVWLELLKLRITAASSVTTVVGYVLARGRFETPLLAVTLGILLQACGAAALNQLQDAAIDARMARTAGRPIPSGRVSRAQVLIFSLGLLAVGSALLAMISTGAALLGLAAAVVYNGIYTPLKRVTPFAALPGALIGALPPVVGWVAAGGYLNDPEIHLVAFFFFLWQIPHFWLLLLRYEKDYADGGLPSLFDRFDRRQIVRLTFTWIAALAVAAMLIPFFGIFAGGLAAWILTVAGFILVVRAASLLRLHAAAEAERGTGIWQVFDRSCKLRFMEINSFALAVSLLLVVDRLTG